MLQQNQIHVSAGILKLCSVVGFLGAAMEMAPILPIKEFPEEAAAFIGAIGSIAFSISLAVVLLFTVRKIKQTREKKPSPIVIYILIGTALLTVIGDLCTLGGQESEDIFYLIPTLLFACMMIITGILCLLETATKKIGLWMIFVFVGSLLGVIICESLNSINKLTGFIAIGIVALPVGMMFDAFKNYLLGDES